MRQPDPTRARLTGLVANLSWMLVLAADWSTIASVLTGVGTLVLAVATFASVRSANRSARIAEAALQEQRRPVLAPSRFDDPVQKIMFVEGHWVSAAGGRGTAENVDGAVLLTISLRNVGSGIGVCQGWTVRPGLAGARALPMHAELDEFRIQTRDMYIPAGDIGMWQGGLRNPDDPLRATLAEAIDSGDIISIELLYTDQIGQQRTITRFAMVPTGDARIVTVTRHWYLDWDGPRPESEILAATETVWQDRDAAERRAEEDAAAPEVAPDAGAREAAREGAVASPEPH
jgi:hypothetical protein